MFPEIKLAYAHRELHRVPLVESGGAGQEVKRESRGENEYNAAESSQLLGRRFVCEGRVRREPIIHPLIVFVWRLKFVRRACTKCFPVNGCRSYHARWRVTG